jgi:hypothetical protein
VIRGSIPSLRINWLLSMASRLGWARDGDTIQRQGIEMVSTRWNTARALIWKVDCQPKATSLPASFPRVAPRSPILKQRPKTCMRMNTGQKKRLP